MCRARAVGEVEMQHSKQLEHKHIEMAALRSQYDEVDRQHNVQLMKLQIEVSNNCYLCTCFVIIHYRHGVGNF